MFPNDNNNNKKILSKSFARTKTRSLWFQCRNIYFEKSLPPHSILWTDLPTDHCSATFVSSKRRVSRAKWPFFQRYDLPSAVLRLLTDDSGNLRDLLDPWGISLFSVGWCCRQRRGKDEISRNLEGQESNKGVEKSHNRNSRDILFLTVNAVVVANKRNTRNMQL